MAQILILEEDKRHYQLIKQCLEDKRHSVLWVTEIDDGLRLLKKYSFDLIVSAINLKDGCVLDFLRSVKNMPTLRDIPFIFCCADGERISNFATPENQTAAIGLGAEKYILLTAFDARELWAELEDCLPKSAVKGDALGGAIKTYAVTDLR